MSLRYSAAAAVVESQVHDQILRGVDPDSDRWLQLYKACNDAVNNVYYEGITEQQWFDAAMAVMQRGAA